VTAEDVHAELPSLSFATIYSTLDLLEELRMVRKVSTLEGRAVYDPSKPYIHKGDAVSPQWVYSHADGCSITGGYVYRGASVPAAQGRYVFGDYCSGTLWSFKVGASGRASAPSSGDRRSRRQRRADAGRRGLRVGTGGVTVPAASAPPAASRNIPTVPQASPTASPPRAAPIHRPARRAGSTRRARRRGPRRRPRLTSADVRGRFALRGA
jgi:hypothetical protein